MSRFNFTKAEIIKLPIPMKGRKYYHDIVEKGLQLSVTSNGTRSFYLRKRIQCKDERVFIGHFPDITIEQARKFALQHKSDIARGINPNFKKSEAKKEITFGGMFEEFMERYSKKYKLTWKADQSDIAKFLSHWFTKKASSITKQEIQLIMEGIKDKNGLYQANRLFERIRAIYNKHIEWGWIGTNPTIGIRKFKEKSRDRFIQPDELPRFFKALKEESNVKVRDYIWISLLTGARKSNVLAMKWNEINFTRREWRISDTKNGDPLTIPLSERAIDILNSRLKSEEYVFPSKLSKMSYLQDPKKAWARILKKANIKDLRIHDLRRTLGSWQVATGASLPIIGKSLGHKTQQATAVYARLNLDPVRESVNKATEAMFILMNDEEVEVENEKNNQN
jgi:integrase